ncbi:MAG: hypothetical protein WAV20_10045, partial [Blastocatellia bacterium]
MFPRAKPIGTAAEPREEMVARTCPRAKPIGIAGGEAAGGDGRAHLPEGEAHRHSGGAAGGDGGRRWPRAPARGRSPSAERAA